MSYHADRRTVILGGSAAMALGLPSFAFAASSPPPPIQLKTVLAGAESAKGKRTIYGNGAEPPREGVTAWPAGQVADCSGFVGWCFGLPRKPTQLEGGLKLGTDQMYDDAMRRQGNRLFVRTEAPTIGDIIVYPNYRTTPDKGDSGHVALLTGKGENGHFATIECASTPFDEAGDAIAFGRGEDVFIQHAALMLKTRKLYPAIPAKLTRPPIYARYLGLIR